MLSPLVHRLRRFRFRNSISNPFLSGDIFALNSDLVVTEKRLKNQDFTGSEVSLANSIFCQSHLLDSFLSEFGRDVRARILICGNSDFDFNYEPKEMPKSIELCLFQNLAFRQEKYVVLPIGIENLRLAVNGFPAFFNPSAGQGGKIQKVLVGPFSPTHTERDIAKDLQGINRYCDYFKNRFRPKEYHKLLSKYQYVFCPRGNGIDTHRFWETLYHGGIPIVMESEWAENIKVLGIPMVTLNEHSDFESQLQQIISRRFNFNPERVRELWWPYWDEKIKSYT